LPSLVGQLPIAQALHGVWFACFFSKNDVHSVSFSCHKGSEINEIHLLSGIDAF